jgi:hypothetical protein
VTQLGLDGNKEACNLYQIKATCDELEMTEIMSFKYNWNREIICQFYATLYFDADGQQYEVIVLAFVRLLGFEH